MHTPKYLIVLAFIYTGKNMMFNPTIAIVIMPYIVKSQMIAKYILYITGFFEFPGNYIVAVALPWVLGAIINHM